MAETVALTCGSDWAGHVGSGGFAYGRDGASDQLSVPGRKVHTYKLEWPVGSWQVTRRANWYHADGSWRRETNGGPVTAEIRTTHVGSLPRSAEVTDLLFAAERGEPVDERAVRRDHDGGGRRGGPAPGRGGHRPGLRRRDGQDQLRDLHQGPDHRLRRRLAAPAAGRPRGLPGLPAAPGQQRRHADLPAAALRRRGRAADPGAAGGGPAPVRAGAGPARRDRPVS